jgi:hypothetical protein
MFFYVGVQKNFHPMMLPIPKHLLREEKDEKKKG